MDVRQACGILGRHLSKSDFGEFTAEMMEQQAKDRSIDSSVLDSDISSGEKRAEVMCSTFSWLWAANAYAIEENPEKFMECMENFGKTLASFESTVPIETHRDYCEAANQIVGHPAEAYAAARELVEAPECTAFYNWEDDENFTFDKERQQECIEAAVGMLPHALHLCVKKGMPKRGIPPGPKAAAIQKRMQDIQDEIDRLVAKAEGFRWYTLPRTKSQNAECMHQAWMRKEELGRELNKIRLVDDAQIYESHNGYASIGFGELVLDFAHTFVPGNLAVIATREWHSKKMNGKDNTPKYLNSGILSGNSGGFWLLREKC